MESIKEEICGIYQSINRREKRQRADQVVEIGDKNITHLTTTKRASAAKSLKFTDSSTSSTTAEYVATTCTSYSRPAVFFGNPLAWTSPQYSGAELVRQAFSAPLSTSTPVSTQRRSNQSQATETATVKLSVSYSSKTVNKTFTKDYEALGKALIHGPPSRIATAVLKCAPLTHLVIEKVFRLLLSLIHI